MEGVRGQVKERPSPGNTGSTCLEEPGTRSHARMGHYIAYSADLKRGVARGGRLPLSGAPSHGAGAMDPFRMGRERKQSTRALLPAHDAGSEATGRGAR